ncbi:MAG: hypothetical protein M1838_005187 [Thelocarpon superellum]|nr:MAG: hypothetical protein M1838_005187 [Thelocarpon superellum]
MDVAAEVTEVKERVALPLRPAANSPKPPKAAKAPKPPKAPREPRGNGPPTKEKHAGDNVNASDPDSMFKEGFLSDVFREKPSTTVITRFPPEPNGYLHIGHSKAIAINFGFARFHGGVCYLRFDDTNPEKEEEQYFTAIKDIIEWLGFTPYAITHSSDHFDKLYELAEALIRKDRAYVCHCTAPEVNLQRGGPDRRGPRYGCPHRSRPIEESLAEFRAMRDGRYGPKEAFLRMKQNYEDGNPQMWDLTAYRILDTSHHPRTGDKWKIYPTYDFTHCLCDSFENISHSLCTAEFINSRESYNWLCDTLEVYRPMQREYGRLNMEGTVLSKRKIAKLIKDGHVRGWDDPRLFTLVGLRRRGIPPGAILSFVNELGVSTAVSKIQAARLDNCVRRYLEQTVPRLMVLLDPIPVIIDNLADDYLEEIELPFSPKKPEFGQHTVPFTRTIYIDRTDFKEVDSPDYFRLAPGKAVGLFKVPFPIRATSFTTDAATGHVKEVHATYEKPEEGVHIKKPKAYIQWVAASPKHNSPIKVEARLFNPLILSKKVKDVTSTDILLDSKQNEGEGDRIDEGAEPAGVPATDSTAVDGQKVYPAKGDEAKPTQKGTPGPEGEAKGKGKKGKGAKNKEIEEPEVSIVNSHSEEVFPHALIETGFDEVRRRAPWPAKEGERDVTGAEARAETVRFQGMRVAYFAMDQDQVDGKIVLNRIVGLKEDSGKG